MRILLLVAVTALLSLLGSCVQDKCEQTVTYKTWEPVYLSYEELRAGTAIRSEAPRDMKAPGKIYFRGSWIFVSEVNEGIHIIDNSNPADPKKLAFITVPGNRDIAVKGDILYADSYVDLVAIDIRNPANVQLTQRQEGVFPFRSTLPNGWWAWADAQKGVVKEWVEVEKTETLDCNSWRGGGWLEDLAGGPRSNGGGPASGGGNFNSSQPGVGGSMARFTIVGEVLYVVTDTDLVLFNLSNAAVPVSFNRINLGWQIETIFPYNNHLFIGSQTGTYIYNIDNNFLPQKVADFEHAQACDPVVAQDNRAYITIRSDNTTCPRGDNELIVVDITNISSPQRMATYSMYNPHGLGIDNGTLFICDGTQGLKIYDASDPYAISQRLIKHYRDIQATDVIPLGEVLLMIGEDGLFQYNYSNLNDIRLLSVIPRVK